MVFSQYARYYDTLYAEKDYAAECDFLETLFRTYAATTPVQRVLDLGCGTGGHAIPLAHRGYQLTGIDRSEIMLATARKKASQAGVTPNFRLGDLCGLKLNQTFDAVIAMFAVLCYQTTNNGLIAAFRSARRHLIPNGLFIFDGWFGPAVLMVQPSERIKVITHEDERLIRLTQPTLDVLAHTVRVDYTVLCLKGDHLLDEANEAHLMRFLFLPEIELICRATGFELIECCPFLGPGKKPTEADWNVSWIVRAV